MENALEVFIREKVKQAKEDEVEEILEIFRERIFRRGERFKDRNTKINELGFLSKGSSRSYMINKKGDEVTGLITQENNFISDLISLRTNEKTPTIVEFLEESVVSVASIEEVRRLLERNLTFNILIREHLSDRFVEIAKRMVLLINGTAKERYQFMIETNPGLLKKFPLRFIASMIGITPTQLSRIRNPKS